MNLPSPKSSKKKNLNLTENRRTKASSVLQVYSDDNYNSIQPANFSQTSNSVIISDSSSINHLEVAENEKDGHWIPYKNNSPKKFDFSKINGPWKVISKKSLPANPQTLNDITVRV